MKIIIETIPHADHRYPTCGDWYDKDGVLHIKVSQELPHEETLLVAVHELVEAILCKYHGITEDMVDAFDVAYEDNRKAGDDSEPGDHSDAPYRKEHFLATNVERMMAVCLDVDWIEYEKHLNALP